MKTKNLIVLFIVLLLAGRLNAQMWGQKPILSPEILNDNKITFRLFAPDAQKVELNGNWMPGWGTRIELQRNDTGMYQVTIEPLPSEVYTYSYFVNGVK